MRTGDNLSQIHAIGTHLPLRTARQPIIIRSKLEKWLLRPVKEAEMFSPQQSIKYHSKSMESALMMIASLVALLLALAMAAGNLANLLITIAT